MDENGEKTVTVEEIHKRKPNIQTIHKMKWVNDLDYSGHTVSVMELGIEKGKKEWKAFQWVTSLGITARTAAEFAGAGRKRWLIENEGFNIQKNMRYYITHANSLNYEAMKNHYLLTQLADILLQLYERGVKGLRAIKRTIKEISDGLYESLKNHQLTTENMQFDRMQVRQEPI